MCGYGKCVVWVLKMLVFIELRLTVNTFYGYSWVYSRVMYSDKIRKVMYKYAKILRVQCDESIIAAVFFSYASMDRPGNIPVVIAYPSTLYQTQKELQQELTLPLGTVVNAVFKNEQWLYAQTPHGDEGYVMYSACLPLGILPNRPSPLKKTPCWESSTDIYPRPCGNLTDTEKEQLRGRTRSECRLQNRKQTKNSCAEKNFDTLYLKTKSFSSIDNVGKEKSLKRVRPTLLVVNCDFKGSPLNKTLTVHKGDVVVLVQGGGIEADVDADWFYVRKRDGSQGFIPAVVAGNGYI